MKKYPLAKVFQLIEPGPVVLITTLNKKKPNVMTLSWHMAMEFEPPLIACVLSAANYSFEALSKTKECVLAIPTIEMIKTVVDIGNCSGENTDKFKTFGLTPRPAKQVKAPLIAECLANLECRVVNNSWSEKYNLFVLKVVRAWIDPEHREKRTFHANGDGIFVLDGRTVNLKKRMTKWKDYL